MIRLVGVTKSFGGRPALRGLDLAVDEGEIFGFVGPNGAGKTTALRILATLTAADAGVVEVAGIPVAGEPAAVREVVGYMPDSFGVYDRLTVREYLEFYGACHRVPRRRRGVVADQLLELVDLGDRRDDDVDTLSRGMKQRLCLARALVHDPKLLLLDEPASGLDPRARFELRELMIELSRMGKTIVVSSHILPELEDFCGSVGLIDDGRLVASGPLAPMLQGLGTHRTRVGLADTGTAELDRAAGRIERRAGVRQVLVVGDHLEVEVDSQVADEDLLADLVRAGLRVRSFDRMREDLADVFLRLTGPVADGARAEAS